MEHARDAEGANARHGPQDPQADEHTGTLSLRSRRHTRTAQLAAAHLVLLVCSLAALLPTTQADPFSALLEGRNLAHTATKRSSPPRPPPRLKPPTPPPPSKKAQSATKKPPPRPAPAQPPPRPPPSRGQQWNAAKKPPPPPPKWSAPKFPPPPPPAQATSSAWDVVGYNTVVGIQQVNPLYGFTSDSALVEAARVTMAMGINTFKFALDPTKYSGTTTWANGVNLGGLTASLRDIASMAPDVVKVLDTPFANILMWVTVPATLGITNRAIQNFTWDDNAYNIMYKQTYDLTVYLLQRYSGSGRTFFLGNWEGDWGLTALDATGKRILKHPDAAKGCIRWLRARQSAVDNAKADIRPTGVEVYHYYEVNLVNEARFDPTFPCATNFVVPFAPVDFISLSSYAVLGPPNQPQDLTNLVTVMNLLANRMVPRPLTNYLNPSKAAPFNKRVFIGEYGFKCGPGGFYNHAQAATRAANVARRMISWGAPFVLYWQLYNNVECSGNCGFMLVDQSGTKLPAYNMHLQYTAAARSWVSTFKANNGRVPTPQEFTATAGNFIGTW